MLKRPFLVVPLISATSTLPRLRKEMISPSLTGWAMMVLVIITRNIDLSVGSIMGMVGMYMGLL